MSYKVIKMVTMTITTITTITMALQLGVDHHMIHMQHFKNNMLGTGSISTHR
jgi:hypothetical protein